MCEEKLAIYDINYYVHNDEKNQIDDYDVTLCGSSSDNDDKDIIRCVKQEDSIFFYRREIQAMT